MYSVVMRGKSINNINYIEIYEVSHVIKYSPFTSINPSLVFGWANPPPPKRDASPFLHAPGHPEPKGGPGRVHRSGRELPTGYHADLAEIGEFLVFFLGNTGKPENKMGKLDGQPEKKNRKVGWRSHENPQFSVECGDI